MNWLFRLFVCFYTHFYYFSSSVKNIIGILIGFAFTLWMTGSTRILLLILLYMQGIASHLPVNYLISPLMSYGLIGTEILPLWLNLFLGILCIMNLYLGLLSFSPDTLLCICLCACMCVCTLVESECLPLALSPLCFKIGSLT